MPGDFPAGLRQAPVELNKRLADQGDGVQHDPFGRRDLVLFMISIVILLFAMGWVAPW
jgi:hypothetical protein